VCARDALNCHNCGAKLDLRNIQPSSSLPSPKGERGDSRVVIVAGKIASTQEQSVDDLSKARMFSDEDIDFVSEREADQINASANALGL
jgi:hypothetical protein